MYSLQADETLALRSWKLLDVVEDFRKIHAAKTGSRVPALSGLKAIVAAAALAALVVALRDVLERRRVLGVDLVKQRVDKAERRLAVLEAPAVVERNHRRSNWARR